jgi:hypothetical protein
VEKAYEYNRKIKGFSRALPEKRYTSEDAMGRHLI